MQGANNKEDRKGWDMGTLYWVGQNVGSGFSETLYGKNRTNFLANPIPYTQFFCKPKNDRKNKVYFKKII